MKRAVKRRRRLSLADANAIVGRCQRLDANISRCQRHRWADWRNRVGHGWRNVRHFDTSEPPNPRLCGQSDGEAQRARFWRWRGLEGTYFWTLLITLQLNPLISLWLRIFDYHSNVSYNFNQIFRSTSHHLIFHLLSFHFDAKVILVNKLYGTYFIA